jgi:quercetin dioxygenase-like cupin family protein
MNTSLISPLVSHIDDYEWDYLPGEKGKSGAVRWKTLIGNQSNDTRGISFGVFEMPPGTRLDSHYHAEHEVYYVYQGEGEVLLDEEVVAVKTGSVLFVPGNLIHGIKNSSNDTIGLIWVIPSDKWVDVEYHMLERNF